MISLALSAAIRITVLVSEGDSGITRNWQLKLQLRPHLGAQLFGRVFLLAFL